ncbi:uncharacterized protein RBU57_015763 isoform 1-T2 [Macrochelys suwanniensis]
MYNGWERETDIGRSRAPIAFSALMVLPSVVYCSCRGPSRPLQQPQTEEEHLEEVDLRNLGVSLGRGAEQLLRCWRSRFPNEIGQRRDWPTCGRDQRRSRHPEPIPRDGSQTVTCRRDRPGAQPEERLEDVNLSSLDVLISRDEQTSAFCLRHNCTKGTEVEGQSRLPHAMESEREQGDLELC